MAKSGKAKLTMYAPRCFSCPTPFHSSTNWRMYRSISLCEARPGPADAAGLLRDFATWPATFWKSTDHQEEGHGGVWRDRPCTASGLDRCRWLWKLSTGQRRHTCPGGLQSAGNSGCRAKLFAVTKVAGLHGDENVGH
jgi:hypothetical protein